MPIKNFFKKSNKEVKKEKDREYELKLVKDIYQKYEDSKQAKQNFVSTWDNCLQAYDSTFFQNSNKPDYKTEEISNYIFSTLETIKPIMVENDPKIQVLPKNPDSVLASEVIQYIIEAEWERDDMSIKTMQIADLSLKIGTVVVMNHWDGNDNNGLGNVKNTLINPYNFFPDPMGHCIEDMEYCIYAKYIHVNKLKKMYPDKEENLIGMSINESDLVFSTKDVSNVDNQVLVLECHMTDYTTVDFEEIDEDTGKKVKSKKRKYPKGRIVVVAPELDILLEDKEQPYESGKPFIVFKCYDVPFQFWGKGEVENLISPQQNIIDLANQVIDNAKCTANNAWLIDRNAGIGKGTLTNRPGLVIRKNPGTEVRRIPAPPLPAYVFDMIETLKRDIEVISGIHDVTQGRKPGSMTAGVAIMALQEAAQGRIRLKVKHMEKSIGKLGKKWLENIKQFWVTERWVRFMDENEQPQFIEVSPEQLQIDVDIFVVGGSTMPQNRSSMFDLMIRLAQTPAEDGLPMVDREGVLGYAGLPNKRQIISRMTKLVEGNKQEQQSSEEQQRAMQEQQMMQDQQMQIERMKTQGSIDAEAQQPTEQQLNSVLETLMQNPELLQMVLSQIPQGNTPLV